MRCRRSERAAGERAERLVRGEGESEGESAMRNLSDREKILFTYFCILENRNHRIFKPRQHSRSALAAMHPEAARGGKKLRNHVARQRTGNEFRPNRGTRPLVTAD